MKSKERDVTLKFLDDLYNLKKGEPIYKLLVKHKLYPKVTISKLKKSGIIDGDNVNGHSVCVKRNASVEDILYHMYFIEPKHTNHEANSPIYRSFKHLSITVYQYNKLCKEYDSEDVNDILNRIENYSKNKKYTSLYLTAKAWLRRRFDQQKDINNSSHINLIDKVNDVIESHIQEKIFSLKEKINDLNSELNEQKSKMILESYFNFLGFKIKIKHRYDKQRFE